MDEKAMKEILDKLTDMSVSQASILANQANQQKVLEEHSSLLKTQGETLLRNTITVEEHHRRSTSLENRQDRLENEVDNLKTEVATTRSNKQYLKDFFITLGYIAAGVPAVGGVIWGIYQLAKKLGI